jgi:hypothetical protein
MSRLLVAGYVSQVGDLIWLTYKGIQLLRLMDDEEEIQLPSIRPAVTRVSVFCKLGVDYLVLCTSDSITNFNL